MKKLKAVRHAALRALRAINWLPPLLARLTVGLVFALTGWGKVHHLAQVTGFFATLGIPEPAFVAGLVGYSELICGVLVLVGLLTRLAAIPLITTMIVALATAQAGEIHDLPSLFGLIEWSYLALLVYLGVMGPGAISIDALIAHAIERTKPGFGVPVRPSGRFEHRHA
jgi:putative oxidoreductase